jgi:hypothetical protein
MTIGSGNYESKCAVAITTSRRLHFAIALSLAAASAHADVFSDAKPIVDVRLRYESVEQVGVVNDADALTIRARLGVETGKVVGTTLLAEGSFNEPLVRDYNDTIAAHDKITYATVADPQNYTVNRLQLMNTSLPQTAITVGRQRINLDDQRFVGNSGWRQNEQTFDAARIVNKSVENLTIDATYLDQTNRVFGKDSPQGAYKGTSYLGNVSYQTPIGKFTVFDYLLKFDPIAAVPAAVRDSSATYGGRFAGEQPTGNWKIGYTASYAKQREYGENPLIFDNKYYLGELSLSYRIVSFGVGYEDLGGDGAKGFTTPLATLHKFQGWADKFLTTPANGVKDTYASLGLSMKSVGPFDTLSASAIYHDYKADYETICSVTNTCNYGSEVNLLLQAKWKRFTGALKYADYSADKLFTDTKKLWAQIEFVW